MKLLLSKTKIFIFTLLIIAFFIPCLELLIGLFSPIDDIRKSSFIFHNQVKEFHPYTKVYKPNQKWVLRSEWRPEGDKYFSPDDNIKFFTDEKSYISTSFNYERKGLENKIIFVGGSTTECNEVDEEFRFPFLVGKILGDQYSLFYDTLNYGVRGHTTQDSINLLMYYHRYEYPQYIVLMHNINDLSWLKNNLTYKFYPPESSFKLQLLDLIEYFRFRSNIVFLINSFLIDVGIANKRFPGDHRPTVDVAIELERQKARFSKKQFLTNIKSLFEKNLNLFVEICRIHGINAILMTQPTGKDDHDHVVFNESIRGVAKKFNVPLIDLDKLIKGDRSRLFYPDNIHLNNEGSIQVATKISQELAKIISDYTNFSKTNQREE